MDLEHTPLPDMFANEMIATYFSYNFFKSIEGKDLLNLELFSEFISGNYQPKFRRSGQWIVYTLICRFKTSNGIIVISCCCAKKFMLNSKVHL